jgi:hypothetical protein
MNFVTFAKMTLAAGFLTVSLLGQPSAAFADDVVVDGRIITAENFDAAADSSTDGDLAAPDAQVQPTVQSDPEYKYVPVRRYFSSTADAADGGDHDILYDPDDDLLPPVRPVGDEVVHEFPWQVAIR